MRHTHMGPGNFQIHGHLSINPQLIFPLPMNAHVSERLLVFNLIHVEVDSKKMVWLIRSGRRGEPNEKSLIIGRNSDFILDSYT